MPVLGNPGLSRSLAAVASLGIYGGFLLGRPVPEGSGEGGVGLTEGPVSWSPLQVEHVLMQGAKAAGAVLSAVVDSIRPKSVTA